MNDTATTGTWKVYQKEYKSNGQPFPYQQDVITWFWLTSDGRYVKDSTLAHSCQDHRTAKALAKAYRGTAGKF